MRVFISYTQDSDSRKAQVVELAFRLRGDGIECNIDQFTGSPQEGWINWMTNQIESSDFVLVVCTDTYRRRAQGLEESGKGRGAAWEGRIIAQYIYENPDKNSKIIPLVLHNEDVHHIPVYLRSYQHFNVSTDSGYIGLIRLLTNQPEILAPSVASSYPILPARTIQSTKSQQHQKSYDDLNISPISLSDHARRILGAREERWGALLFAQVINDEIRGHRKLRFQHESKITPGPRNHVDATQIGEWVNNSLAEVERIFNNVSTLTNKTIQSILSINGDSNSPEKVILTASAIADAYREAIEWSLRIQNTSSHECFDQAIQLLSQGTNDLISKLESYDGAISESITGDTHSSNLGPEHATVLKIDFIDIGTLLGAFRDAANCYKTAKKSSASPYIKSSIENLLKTLKAYEGGLFPIFQEIGESIQQISSNYNQYANEIRSSSTQFEYQRTIQLVGDKMAADIRQQIPRLEELIADYSSKQIVYYEHLAKVKRVSTGMPDLPRAEVANSVIRIRKPIENAYQVIQSYQASLLRTEPYSEKYEAARTEINNILGQLLHEVHYAYRRLQALELELKG